jgi:hypothetical protein
MLILIKPKYIYDYNKLKFKEFGIGDDKQLITLYSIAILSAIIIAVIFMSKKNNKNDDKYIPIKLQRKNKKKQCIQSSDNEYVYVLQQ